MILARGQTLDPVCVRVDELASPGRRGRSERVIETRDMAVLERPKLEPYRGPDELGFAGLVKELNGGVGAGDDADDLGVLPERSLSHQRQAGLDSLVRLGHTRRVGA